MYFGSREYLLSVSYTVRTNGWLEGRSRGYRVTDLSRNPATKAGASPQNITMKLLQPRSNIIKH